jgi:integrase
MARKVKDAVLDSREARRRLKARGRVYWRAIEHGLHVGYRRLKGKAGTWWSRHYLGAQRYAVEPLGIADDISDADGATILTYWQAQTKARERMAQRAQTGTVRTRPLTVADAVNAYLDWLDTNRRSGYEARKTADASILPALGKHKVEKLTADMLRQWHVALAQQPARIRTKKGAPQRYRAFASDDEEAVRSRRVTANRILTILKAALNRAWREGLVESDSAWRRVKPFENVESARIRYLTVAEAQRLINACDPDIRLLVQAALQTGARYGELVRLQVSDFNPDSGTVAIRRSKSGRSRHVVLTDEGIAFFARMTVGRRGDEPMFLRRGVRPWNKAEQRRPMREACERARIVPPITFHGLRHTWASLAAMNGVPLMVVARNLGHADTRMVEKHYGHLAPSYVADAIRAGAPRFGMVEPDNITPLARPR